MLLALAAQVVKRVYRYDYAVTNREIYFKPPPLPDGPLPFRR